MQIQTINIRLTLFFLWIGHFLVDMMIGIWPVFKTMAHLDLAVAGIISSIAAFAGEGSQIFFGPLSDRGYGKTLIFFGVIVTCASSLFPYAPNYWGILGLFFLTCLGSGAFHPSAAGFAGALTSSNKSLCMTIFASGGSLGIAFSQIVFTHTFQALDRHIYLLAIPSLLLAVLIYLFFQKMPKTNSQHPTNWRELLRLFRYKELRLLYFVQVFNQALFWGIVFLLPDLLLSRGYDTWVCFGGGHLFYMIGGAAMMIFSGFLADKYSPRNVILIAIASSFILFNIFLFSTGMPLPFLMGLIFLNGAALGLVNPVLVSMGNRLMPANPGMVSAFLMGLAWCFSEVVGLGGAGLLTKLFEDDAPAKALGLLCAVCMTVSLALTWRFPKQFVVLQPSSMQVQSLD